MSVLMLGDLKRWDARGQIFQTNIHNYARTVCPKTNKLGVVTPIGRGVFLEGQPCPLLRGRSPSAPQFWELASFYMPVSFDAEKN